MHIDGGPLCGRKQLDPCLGKLEKRKSKNQGLEAGPPTERHWLLASTFHYLLKVHLEAALILGSLIPAVSIEHRHGPGMGATPH